MLDTDNTTEFILIWEYSKLCTGIREFSVPFNSFSRMIVYMPMNSTWELRLQCGFRQPSFLSYLGTAQRHTSVINDSSLSPYIFIDFNISFKSVVSQDKNIWLFKFYSLLSRYTLGRLSLLYTYDLMKYLLAFH